MSFDFDEEIDRRVVPALKHHAMVLGEGGEHLFAAGVADMDFRVAPAIAAALRERAEHDVYGYEAMPDGLIPALTGWQAARHGWTLDPAHVLRAPNALNSLALAVSLFSAPGEGIIVQPPVFFDFFDVIRENGRSVVENPLVLADGRYEMDFDGLEALAARPENRVLFLCNPHNPVGRVWTRDELARLAAICDRHGVLVVSDELHGDLGLPGHGYTPFATVAKDCIALLSPARSFNIAGCCSSFVVVPDDGRRRAWAAESSRLTVNKNNAFASVAMLAAYQDGGPWLDAALQYLRGNLALLRDRLAGASVRMIEPEGTFLVWLDFQALGLDPDDLHGFLRGKAGWAVTRGVSFGTGGTGFVRLNIACPRARLDVALERLLQALSG